MVARVSPAVVQVLATAYGAGDDGPGQDVTARLQQRVGSGVVVGSDGYVMTNAHVVDGAQAVKVRLVRGTRGLGDVLAQSFAPTLDAAIVGTYADADLALLKIPAQDLPTLPIAGVGAVRQGQVVFAFGSPNGLQNSVTMGVVSSIARQVDPDNPFLYIQTDAPINPGNSGGPLVGAAGELLGLNTFISTQSGGSEGMGFAVPAGLVNWVYGQLRKNGHVTRPTIGAGLQTITPVMATALGLMRTSGVIVSDVLPGSPAADAGIKLNDILLKVGGRTMDNVAAWTGVSFEHVPGALLPVEILRGSALISLAVKPIDTVQPSLRLPDTNEVARSQITQLGIMAVTLDERTAPRVGPTRLVSGALIIARGLRPDAPVSDLRPGDLIHRVNGKDVYTVDNLREALVALKSGDAVALLVEREGRWFYVSFQLP